MSGLLLPCAEEAQEVAVLTTINDIIPNPGADTEALTLKGERITKGSLCILSRVFEPYVKVAIQGCKDKKQSILYNVSTIRYARKCEVIHHE